ncbi:hypothetical protein HY993_04565 [Candidatus Micrarchaeota archaeon]|nr:hypothetical protein [Candidatus Micrarchaeota archaeon]
MFEEKKAEKVLAIIVLSKKGMKKYSRMGFEPETKGAARIEITREKYLELKGKGAYEYLK